MELGPSVGSESNSYKIPKERDNFRGLDVSRRLILKWLLKKRGMRMWRDWFGAGQCPMACSGSGKKSS